MRTREREITQQERGLTRLEQRVEGTPQTRIANDRSYRVSIWITLSLIFIPLIAVGFLLYQTQNRLDKANSELSTAHARESDLQQKIDTLNSAIKALSDQVVALGGKPVTITPGSTTIIVPPSNPSNNPNSNNPSNNPSSSTTVRSNPTTSTTTSTTQAAGCIQIVDRGVCI